MCVWGTHKFAAQKKNAENGILDGFINPMFEWGMLTRVGHKSIVEFWSYMHMHVKSAKDAFGDHMQLPRQLIVSLGLFQQTVDQHTLKVFIL